MGEHVSPKGFWVCREPHLALLQGVEIALRQLAPQRRLYSCALHHLDENVIQGLGGHILQGMGRPCHQVACQHAVVKQQREVPRLSCLAEQRICMQDQE